MDRLFNLIADIVPSESATPAKETLTGTTGSLDPVSILLCTIGLCIGITWLFWFGGFRALRNAPVRRCRRWFIYWPLAILTVWLVMMGMIQSIVTVIFGSESQTFQDMISYPLNAALQIGLIAAMLIIVCKSFVRGLKGFGINGKNIITDIQWAAVNLLGTFPLILFGLWIALLAGRLFKGMDFSLEVHQTLNTLTDAGIGLRILVVVFASVIVPIFEELLFRGFFQTSLRSFTGNPWLAIILTSAFFAILHPPTHIPALFLFSCGLGYAYERSGSLLRPILMHIFFNGFNITVTILLS